METKIDYRLALVIAGGVLFQYLFWDEFLGTNLFIFSIFILGITLSDREIIINKKSLIIAFSHIMIAGYIVYNNSILAITTWFISLLAYLGSIHFIALKSISTTFIFGILQVASGPFRIFSKIKSTKLGKLNYQPSLKIFKYIVAPFILVVIFCSLYAIANPTFDKYISYFTDGFRSFFLNIFDFLFVDISFSKCAIILIGCFVTAGFIFSIKSKLLQEAEFDLNQKMIRKRRNLKEITFGYEMQTLFFSSKHIKKLALKTENTVGIISFSALNILLALLNTIDFSTIWLERTHNNYSAELHDGTNTLIISIVIAMAIIIYFFSGNLNFYSRNKTIKTLVYIWIAQNAFLVASVFLRDYFYIYNHGLTYKRIGIAIFATLCIIGLATVWIKVAKQKTFFYLYRINSTIWYCLLIILSFINWDSFIVRYNLSKADKIDIDIHHLLSFSEKTIPVLLENKSILMKKLDSETSKNNKNFRKTVESTGTKPLLTTKDIFEQQFETKIERFMNKHDHQTWLSYSYLEGETYKKLKPTNVEN